VQAYSLTRLRIAALVWMGLVGLGLVLICWRMLRGKSGAWLINANAGAALLVLVAACGSTWARSPPPGTSATPARSAARGRSWTSAT
jgi:hypothetical protein